MAIKIATAAVSQSVVERTNAAKPWYYRHASKPLRLDALSICISGLYDVRVQSKGYGKYPSDGELRSSLYTSIWFDYLGLAIGMFSIVILLYQAEIAPPRLRDFSVLLQQFSITICTTISFWLDYGLPLRRRLRLLTGGRL